MQAHRDTAPGASRWIPLRAAFGISVFTALLSSTPVAVGADVVVPAAIQAIVDSPDRTQADRDTDKRRHPAELLAFAGVKPGMKVFDFGTGRGYTAELVARAVGPQGSVVAQTDPIIFERFAKGQWDPRFSGAAM